MPKPKTARHIIPARVENLSDRAIRKVRRDEIAGSLLGREHFRRHAKLLTLLLLEVRDHYVTYPSEIRKGIEEFLA